MAKVKGMSSSAFFKKKPSFPISSYVGRILCSMHQAVDRKTDDDDDEGEDDGDLDKKGYIEEWETSQKSPFKPVGSFEKENKRRRRLLEILKRKKEIGKEKE